MTEIRSKGKLFNHDLLMNREIISGPPDINRSLQYRDQNTILGRIR